MQAGSGHKQAKDRNTEKQVRWVLCGSVRCMCVIIVSSFINAGSGHEKIMLVPTREQVGDCAVLCAMPKFECVSVGLYTWVCELLGVGVGCVSARHVCVCGGCECWVCELLGV